MKTRLPILTAAAAIALFLLAAPPSSAFIYQGVLSQNGTNAQGDFEMQFQLRLAGTTTDVGAPITSPVSVTDGLFSLDLGFPSTLFDGTAYDLQISVRVGGSTDPFIPLFPAQPLTAAPQALFADSVGSVPDDALGSNVARLNQPAVFVTNVSMPLLRLANPTGGGSLIFGPTDDCSIGISPVGPSGLLLRDPRGARILSPDPASPPVLRFGPTDDCSLGIDPAFPGLIGRDPIGFRLLGQNNQGQRLIFGPTDDCSIGIDPTGDNAGLIIEENFGVRITNPSGGASRVIIGTGFGNNPDNLCMIAVDPAGPSGIQLRDPSGVRLLSPPGGASRLMFGPTDDCSLGIDPAGPQGLLLRDPRGIRLLPPAPAPGNPSAAPRLIFGPTDDCSIGIDPTGDDTGLVVYENVGLRVTNPNGGVSRLMFGPGPDDICAIIVDPDPTGIQGMQILEKHGVRIRNPLGGVARLSFGNEPDNLCAIAVDPNGPAGLQLRDPNGIRVLNPTGGASRLVFGNNPDNLCAIGIDPGGPGGLLLRDPSGIRILNPAVGGNPQLIFGPTDDCSITVAPTGTAGAGMRFSDPRGFLFSTPGGQPTQVTVNGPVSAQAFIQTSTRRLKENVQPIENALELIQQLQGVRYDWKAEMGGEADLGFIAEEVGKVIPEVVEWEEDGVNARGIDYARLVAVAMEGIKAQQTEIETLRKERADMETRLSRLEALLQTTRPGQ